MIISSQCGFVFAEYLTCCRVFLIALHKSNILAPDPGIQWGELIPEQQWYFSIHLLLGLGVQVEEFDPNFIVRFECWGKDCRSIMQI